MIVADTFAAVRKARAGRVGLVPTMGYLHEGHLSLVEMARGACETVVVSSFVNRLQFGAGEDLAAYPRDEDRDRRLAEAFGVDVLFAPSDDEMYPHPPLTTVSVPSLSSHLEGRHRPAHFAGVATVVAKLLSGVQPDAAFFGRKDGQQLAVVKQMVADLSMPVEIVAGSTVREASGLALSSRNTYLSEDERTAATSISAGLMAAADRVEQGTTSAEVLGEAVLAELAKHPATTAEYVELASQEDMLLLDDLDRPAMLAVAARVGATRLIDNIAFDFIGGSPVPDLGVRLVGSSMLYREG